MLEAFLADDFERREAGVSSLSSPFALTVHVISG